jgi:hypothetical protein
MATYADNARRFEKGLSIPPASYTATKTGSEVDISQSVDGSVWVVVNVGATATADGSNLFTFTVTSATASGGSFSAEASTAYDAVDSWDRIINATGEANTSYAFNLHPTKPYIKVVATATGSPSVIFDSVVLFQKRHGPANT